jgi:aldehyde dehydrogenase (NAD+)
VLYLIEFEDLDQVLAWHNGVPQGLSSSIFTTNLRAAETFLSARGSDCGIANVNIGTSGAEIGGASVERRKPAAVGRRVATPGRSTCAGRRYDQLVGRTAAAQGNRNSRCRRPLLQPALFNTRKRRP